MKITHTNGAVLNIHPGKCLIGSRLASVELTGPDFIVLMNLRPERLHEWMGYMATKFPPQQLSHKVTSGRNKQ